MKDKMTRKEFIKKAGIAAGAAVSLPAALSYLNGCSGGDVESLDKGISSLANAWNAPKAGGKGGSPKVVIISIDSLDARILYLNSKGEKGGKDGDWLMPNLRAFFGEGTWFEHSRCWMPAATDMNHLNAVAGTNSSLTGIYGVSIQFFDWNADSTAHLVNPSLSFTRDDKGRKVDTIFSAWKRKWPESKTLYSSGKGWVAEMFRVEGSGVDMILTGRCHPSYVGPPKPWSAYDSPAEKEARLAHKSRLQKQFIEQGYEKRPKDFPSDAWIVSASLEVLKREKPDLSVVLMAEMDDAQHGLGAAVTPDEFEKQSFLLREPAHVSKYNSAVYREAILDSMKDIDRQFGLLVKGIQSIPYYKDALIVAYSDHGHVNHRDTVWSNIDPRIETDPVKILYKAGVITADERDGKGLFPYGASCCASMYLKGSMEERRRRGKEFKDVYLQHKIWNSYENKYEVPWHVIGENEAINGLPGVCEKGELVHNYFAYNNEPGKLHLPDISLFTIKGYQIPIAMGLASNLGIKLPWYYPNSIKLMLGGHGSNDTMDILIAMSGPGVRKGKVVSDPGFKKDYRISDIALTLAKRFDLELQSTTIGKERVSDLS